MMPAANPGALGRADRAHRSGHHPRGRAAAGDRQARGRRRARGERRELRRDRDAAGGAARGVPGAGAPARPRHQRLPRDRAQARRRCASCTRCCARTASKSAISRCSRGRGISGQAHRRRRCVTDTRVGGERTVQVTRARQALGERLPSRCSSSAGGHADGGRARDRAHAPDPRARGARRPPGGGRREVRRRGIQRRRCTRSVCGACSCMRSSVSFEWPEARSSA